MKQLHTSRLYFGKYAYKIVFLRRSTLGDKDFHIGWTLSNCREFLTTNNITHKFYSRVRWHGKNKRTVTTFASLFLENNNDYTKCINQWPENIEEVVTPYADNHVAVLQDNIKTVIREKLIYGKFRYVVNFKSFWNEPIEDLDNWIKSNIIDNSCTEYPAKWAMTGWNPRLYLTKEDDLILTKLTWHDSISNTIV